MINFLTRHRYEKLIPYFDLDSQPEILTTNNRSVLGHLNQIKWDVEYHCGRAGDNKDSINFTWIEDLFIDFLNCSFVSITLYLYKILYTKL